MCDVLVLRVLVDGGPMTPVDIARIGELGPTVIKDGLKHLRAARRVYVSGFEDTGVQGRERAIYAVGNLPDAVFVRKAGREYSARYAARHRVEIKMRDRARRNGWNKPLERRPS
jgi:hypothetical protein